MDNTLIKSQKTKITLPVSAFDAICMALCFFVLQANVIGNINPFGIAFLVSLSAR